MASTTKYDVVVVGFGDAGASAAIEAADAGARVLVLDRGYGGGASALSGGVVYAGGGTRYQRAAGLEDSPENMFNYLKQEVRGVVSDTTLRRFTEVSAGTIDWLEEQGATFDASLCTYKTSYPTDEHYLYYSGNEKAWPYNQHATPAARGHRQVAKGMGSGKALFEVLRRAATRKGVAFQPLSRVHSLIIEDGAVVGVRYRTVAPGSEAIAAHQRSEKIGGKLGNWVPPVGKVFNDRAEKVWQDNAVETEVRADAVILSAGGFAFNPQMRAQHAPEYKDVPALGTIGDDGCGITLGVSAGGTTANMERMTSWRFMSPPSALLEGVSVGPSGKRIANEDLYGATHSQIMIDEHNGRGFLVMDADTWRRARAQVPHQTQSFQTAQCAYLFSIGHKKAATLEALAKKLGIDADGLLETISAYNQGVRSGEGDPGHKALELCSPIERGPFYAIDISTKNSFAYPAPGLTLGGLRVDEETGGVLDEQDSSITGLYAAGRNAIGICSNSYLSGTALADGIFSGRRAGVHAAARTKELAQLA